MSELKITEDIIDSIIALSDSIKRPEEYPMWLWVNGYLYRKNGKNDEWIPQLEEEKIENENKNMSRM